MPSLYIITGSNGAGKSSIGPEYLPDNIRANYTVFDGDLLFVNKLQELFPDVTRSPKEAKKLSLEFVRETFDQLTAEALASNQTFVYEGHFTNHATWDIPKTFKAAGYQIHLLFFGLVDPELSQLRVTARAAEGGHFVDRRTLEGNFVGNLEMLNLNFSVIDQLIIVDTSEAEHIILARLESGIISSSIQPADLPWWFTKYLPAITAAISGSV